MINCWQSFAEYKKLFKWDTLAIGCRCEWEDFSEVMSPRWIIGEASAHLAIIKDWWIVRHCILHPGQVWSLLHNKRFKVNISSPKPLIFQLNCSQNNNKSLNEMINFHLKNLYGLHLASYINPHRSRSFRRSYLVIIAMEQKQLNEKQI